MPGPAEIFGSITPNRHSDPRAAVALARSQATALTRYHPENFSVLSVLVPRELRHDFAAVYTFCRTADDLADEGGKSPEARSAARAALNDWRVQLSRCSEHKDPQRGEHPVFTALRPTIARHRLPLLPFEQLIDAFLQDQDIAEYDTWDQLLGYCARSAAPVGHLVLMLAGYRPPSERPANTERYARSDAACIALQLTNFWQDVRRDLDERDRVYLPRDVAGVSRKQLVRWSASPGSVEVRNAYEEALKPCISRTWGLFDQGRPLPALLSPEIAPVVSLFQQGGEAVLRRVVSGRYSTLWNRPRLGHASKAWLLARTWCAAKLLNTGKNTPLVDDRVGT